MMASRDSRTPATSEIACFADPADVGPIFVNGMALERDQACFRFLAWRADLPPTQVATVVTALLASGAFHDESIHPRLHVLRERATEHAIVVVATTGRIQLRLCPASAQQARPFEAVRLAARLATACEASATQPTP